MKIGVDLCNFDPNYTGGLNTFALNTIAGLHAVLSPGDKIVLFVIAGNEAFFRKEFAGSDISIRKLPLGWLGQKTDSLLTLISWLIGNFKLRYWVDRVLRAQVMREIDRAADVIVAPMTVLRFFAMRAPALVSLHDLQQEYHPEFFSWRQRVGRWSTYRLSAWRAERLQASSRYVKDCLVEKFPFISPHKIVVIPEGVDRDKFSPDVRVEMPPILAGLSGAIFIFYPAQIWPHKNHLLLIAALVRYREQTGTEMPCVLTGRDYGNWHLIQDHINAHGLKQIYYLGQVSFAHLLWLYRNCTAVLALGMHESSSLPVREGAVFGKVLIALDIPPNREAQERLKIKLVDGSGPDDLIGALVALSDDETVRTANENVHFVASFDCKIIAKEYYETLKQMI